MPPKGTRIPLERRFWSKVEITDDCWLWSGAKNKDGYGSIRIEGKTVSAHRVSYELRFGSIPQGLVIDHVCRVHHCVNPDHLEPVTNEENLRRGIPNPAALNAVKTHCKHGHEFTPENTYMLPVGGRGCRTCIRNRVRAYKLRLRGKEHTS